MITLQTIYHKKNELFEVEFYKNEECTEAFDFTNAENLYSVLKDGDCTPLLSLPYGYQYYIPYINPDIYRHMQEGFCDEITTLNDITPNLSKYIPEDNAVLFLREEEYRKYCNQFKPTKLIGWLDNTDFDYKDWFQKYNIKTATIFLTHGTQSELQKANAVEKELKEKYGVKEVNLFALHCFGTLYINRHNYLSYQSYDFLKNPLKSIRLNYINKIITTNSTGILKPEDSNERLQVIDGKEIFEEYLKTKR